MALRQFAFYNSTAGYMDTAALTDSAQLSRIDLTGDGSNIAINLSSKFIIGAPTPTQADHVASKSYVDTLVAGVDWKNSVRVASTANVVLATPGATIDGVTMVAGDRVLLKDQTAQLENGIYLWNGAASTMTRSSDGGLGQISAGTAAFVEEGTANQDSGWLVTTNTPIAVGTTAIIFTQFTALGQITAGLGLTKSGATVDIGKGDGIAIAADGISIDLDTNPGLQLLGTSPNGKLSLKNDTTRGLGKDANGTYIILAGTPGLQFSAGALGVLLSATPGLSLTGGVNVVPNAAQAINVGASGVGITLAATPGLQFNSGLSMLIESAKGLAVGASGLATVIEASKGLSVSASGLATVVNAAKSVEVGAGGLGVILATTPGLQHSTGLAVLLEASKGLSVGASGVAGVANAAKSVEVGASGFGVTLATTPGLQHATGLALLIEASKGLSVGASGLAGVANASQGVNVGASGFGITLATNPGLSFNTGLQVLVDPDGGLTNIAAGLSHKLNGTTLTKATAGLSVLGLPALFTVNGVAVSANVTSTNLNSLTGDTTDVATLHGHDKTFIGGTVTTGGGLSAGQAVYFSGNDTVTAGSNNTAGKDNVVGISSAAYSSAVSARIVRAGVVAGVLTSATPGVAYYMGATGLPVTASSLTSGNRVIRLGYAKNATDLDVRIEDVGVRP